jgi:Homeodomain-like domain
VKSIIKLPLSSEGKWSSFLLNRIRKVVPNPSVASILKPGVGGSGEGAKYIVRLAEEERRLLKGLVSKGRASAQTIRRAQTLLKIDAAGPKWTDRQAAEAFGMRTNTVAEIRQRFVEEGLERALDRKQPDEPCEHWPELARHG